MAGKNKQEEEEYSDEDTFPEFERHEEIRIAKEELGLTGAALVEYVDKREAKFDQMVTRQMQYATNRAELQFKKAESKRQAEEGDKQRQHEWNMAQMPPASMPPSSSNDPHVRPLLPKLPKFDETKDDIDSYLKRYEVYAETVKWPEDSWALGIGSLLGGSALEVYTRMSMVEAGDYEALKAALLNHFQLTEDGFRKRFFSSRPAKGETATQFMGRLSDSFDRWINLSGTKREYHQLRDLLVREQFLHGVQLGMATFLRERKPETVGETIQYAERYADAHSLYRRGNQSSIAHPGSRSPTRNGGRKKPTDGDQKPRLDHPNGTTTTSTTGDPSNYRSRRRGCFQCGSYEHRIRDCPNKTESNVCVSTKYGSLYRVSGLVNGQRVEVMRDTGATASLVKKTLVPPDQYTGDSIVIECCHGDQKVYPEARILVKCPYYEGEIFAGVMDQPSSDLVLANLENAIPNPAILPEEPVSEESQGSTEADDEIGEGPQVQHCTVTTRSQAGRSGELDPLPVAAQIPSVGQDELKRQQKEDESLTGYFQRASVGTEIKSGKQGTCKFVMKRDLLYRIFSSPDENFGKPVTQLIVPVGLRRNVLRLAHDALLAGHMGVRRTLDRVTSNFYWPGVHGDVSRYCASCDVCQRTVHKGRVPVAPLEKMPIVTTPFERVACDIVGPIAPMTDRKNRYVLTMIDYATRYPECSALPCIDTEHVAEALVGMFARVGVPKEILTDRGTNFTSEMMSEVCRLLSVKQIHTTPYHAQTNGLCERFQGTLKQMIKRLCHERPKDWDRYLEPLVFAYREVPQESLGFSPFELLYGRTVRGPMSILRDLWAGQVGEDPEVISSYQYVTELRERLEKTCEVARENLGKSQGIQHEHFNRKAKPRTLTVGDQVLILLPTDLNKLVMQWKGPYPVIERMGPTNYKVKVRGKDKVYHINMLRKYNPRNVMTVSGTDGPQMTMSAVAVIEEPAQGEEENLFDYLIPGEEGTVRECQVNPDLSQLQKVELLQLLEEFGDIFSNRPGKTDVIEHEIKLLSSQPIRSRPYPIPYSMVEVMKEEVQSMLELGVIEPSTSPYCSPVVLVRKPDGSIRFCVDFRLLNRITVFDAEPAPDPDAIYATMAKDVWFSSADCCKGYWQIGMKESDKIFTAFSSPTGLHQFTRMPFGLQNACATYAKAMRRILGNATGIDNFVDDSVIHNPTWEEHLLSLREFFTKMRKAGVTLKPKKCKFGFKSLQFLGHEVGNGYLGTVESKVQDMLSKPRPTTKKELRSFIGLFSYYRKFVPNHSTLVVPLTDLLKKRSPEVVEWGEQQEASFQEIKMKLATAPVLQLPDFTRTFVLRTDASGVGLGGVLLQDHCECLCPVLYVSRKLNGAEVNYAVPEKECLAIVWCIDKLKVYLYGREFVLQTDNQPLVYLNQAKYTNARLMRWALLLQSYRFRVEHIKGSTNVGPDWLSRGHGPMDEGDK